MSMDDLTEEQKHGLYQSIGRLVPVENEDTMTINDIREIIQDQMLKDYNSGFYVSHFYTYEKFPNFIAFSIFNGETKTTKDIGFDLDFEKHNRLSVLERFKSAVDFVNRTED